MKIILVQTELERAIREYVGRQLKVAEGNKMRIELSATRGSEGFKAEIDIEADDTPPASSGSSSLSTKAPVGVTRSESNQETTQRHTSGIEFPPSQVHSNHSSVLETEVPPSTEPSAPVEEHISGEKEHEPAQTEVEKTVIAAEAQAQAPAATSSGRSLFKGLTRPKN